MCGITVAFQFGHYPIQSICQYRTDNTFMKKLLYSTVLQYNREFACFYYCCLQTLRVTVTFVMLESTHALSLSVYGQKNCCCCINPEDQAQQSRTWLAKVTHMLGLPKGTRERVRCVSEKAVEVGSTGSQACILWPKNPSCATQLGDIASTVPGRKSTAGITQFLKLPVIVKVSECKYHKLWTFTCSCVISMKNVCLNIQSDFITLVYISSFFIYNTTGKVRQG